MRLRRPLFIGALLLGLWPSLGWLWLHQQGDRIAVQTKAWAIEQITQHTDSTWQSSEFIYQPGLLPRIALHDAEYMLPSTAEPLTIVSATLRARWYSLWVFRWLPQRLDIHQANLLHPIAQDSQLTATDLWTLLDRLPELEPLLMALPSIDVQQFNLTLYDPTPYDPNVAYVVDATIQAFIRRTQGSEYTLSMVADLQGDGWVDHGFGELQTEWRLYTGEQISGAEPITIQRLNAQLEVHSSIRTYGIYRWDTHLEQMRVNPVARTFTAKEFSMSQGASAGRDATEPHEIGERTAWLSMTGGAQPQDWSAEILRRAEVIRPRSAWVNDLIWSLQYEQWSPNPSADQPIGRTEIGWQATLKHPNLARVLVQLNTPAHSGRLTTTPTLTQWQAEPANVAIDITTTQRNYVLRGRANAVSDLDQHQLQLSNMALEEVSGRDAYWLYGHLTANPQGLSIDDLIDPERGLQANPLVDFPAWADCLNPTETVMVVQILNCAAQHRAALEPAS